MSSCFEYLKIISSGREFCQEKFKVGELVSF